MRHFPAAEPQCYLGSITVFQEANQLTQFDIVFADPPYDRGLVAKTLDLLGGTSLISKDGVLVVEHSFREDIVAGNELVLTDQRRYGDTVISFLKPNRG